MSRPVYRALVLVATLALIGGACRSDPETGPKAEGGIVPPGNGATVTSQTAQGPVKLATSDVVTGLDTVWSMAFDRDGKLWFTERPGRVRRQGDGPETIDGVVEQGESGLMGIAFDRASRH
jgi:aldose sugar dehydrogenase